MLYLLCYIVVFIVLAAGASYLAVPQQAVETAKEMVFRDWWNLGWKIANFLVLAFLIVKLAKQPLKDFIKKQRQTVNEQLDEMEERKKEAKAEQERIAQMTAGLAKDLADFEKALTEAAAKEREEMLASAQEESKLILERAQIWAEQSLLKARKQLAAEMLEQAAEIAAETIQKNINDQDRQNFFEQFNSGLKESASL